MTELVPTLLLVWLIAAAIAALSALVRKATGLPLLQVIGLGWLIGRLLK